MCWVCNAPKKSDKSIFSAKRTKNFTEFTKVYDKQAFTGRKKKFRLLLFFEKGVGILLINFYFCFLKKKSTQTATSRKQEKTFSI